MIKVLVIGACGKMGREVVKAVCAQDNMQLVGAVDLVNVGLDVGSIVLNKEIDYHFRNDFIIIFVNVNHYDIRHSFKIEHSL